MYELLCEGTVEGRVRCYKFPTTTGSQPHVGQAEPT